MGVWEAWQGMFNREFPGLPGQEVVRSIRHSSRAYCQLAGYMLTATKPTWNQTTPLTCRYSKKPEVATQMPKLGPNWDGHHQNHHKFCWNVFLSEAIHKPVISLTSGLKPMFWVHAQCHIHQCSTDYTTRWFWLSHGKGGPRGRLLLPRRLVIHESQRMHPGEWFEWS